MLQQAADDVIQALPLDALLPLRQVVVEFEFLRPTRLPFFHQAALSAFLRTVSRAGEAFGQGLRIDAPESGRLLYQAGERYRCSLIVLPGSSDWVDDLLRALSQLPASAPRRGAELIFADNLRLVGVYDGFHGEVVHRLAQLSVYDRAALAEEVALWQGQTQVQWQCLSPMRLLLPKAVRTAIHPQFPARSTHNADDARFCQWNSQVTPSLMLERLYDALASLLRERGHHSVPGRPAPPPAYANDQDLFWLPAAYRDRWGGKHTMGGLHGYSRWQLAEDWPWWPYLILGQYLGLGQRVAFGWGRYQLLTGDGAQSHRRPLPARPLLRSPIANDSLYQQLSRSLAALNERSTLPILSPKPLRSADWPRLLARLYSLWQDDALVSAVLGLLETGVVAREREWAGLMGWVLALGHTPRS